MPETETALTLLDMPFTVTLKEDVGGSMFARARLNVISSLAGVALSINEPRYSGTGAGSSTSL